MLTVREWTWVGLCEGEMLLLKHSRGKGTGGGVQVCVFADLPHVNQSMRRERRCWCVIGF